MASISLNIDTPSSPERSTAALSDSDEELLLQSQLSSTNSARRKRGRAWHAWEDRLLARVTLARDPFTPGTMACPQEEKWNIISEECCSQEAEFHRSGSSCKN